MARVQLVIPDEDRDRFVHQARREGMTLSAWLRAAARQRFEQQQRLRNLSKPRRIWRDSFLNATRWKAPIRNRIGTNTLT